MEWTAKSRRVTRVTVQKVDTMTSKLEMASGDTEMSKCD